VEWLKVKTLSSNPSIAKKAPSPTFFLFLAALGFELRVLLARQALILLETLPAQPSPTFNPQGTNNPLRFGFPSLYLV
jgi:hypothetical protein